MKPKPRPVASQLNLFQAQFTQLLNHNHPLHLAWLSYGNVAVAEFRTVLFPHDGFTNGLLPTPGTLRWAINEINASPDTSNTITFTSSLTIVSVDSELPEIIRPVTIDGAVLTGLVQIQPSTLLFYGEGFLVLVLSVE